MALTQRSEVDRIEVVGPFRLVQVRVADVVESDGVEIARSFRRHVIAPGDDYSVEQPVVQSVCEATHTPEIVSLYASRQE